MQDADAPQSHSGLRMKMEDGDLKTASAKGMDLFIAKYAKYAKFGLTGSLIQTSLIIFRLTRDTVTTQ